MAAPEADSEQEVQWAVVSNEEGQCEPLLVAMQPGVDEPAVEVVVETVTGEQVHQDGGAQVSLQDENGHISVGAMEEVKGDFSDDVVESVEPTIEIKMESEVTGKRIRRPKYRSPSPDFVPSPPRRGGGVRPSKRRRESSSSGSDSDSSSDDDDDSQQPSKKPKKREFAYRLQWRNKDMLEAMKYVLEKKSTIRGAAKKYRVPYSTLKDRIHGRVQHGTKPGVKTVLSPEEEEELVKYIKDMEAAGFQMRCIDVRDRAGEILQLNHGHNTPYKDCSPGHNWLAGFLKRHPGLEFKKSMNRSVVPSIQKQKLMCRRFYDIASQTLKKLRLTTKAEKIFTVAEVQIASFLDATILVGASADGTILPPFVIFPGQKLKLTSARQTYPEAFFTCSYDGRVTEVVFLWWFRDHFLKHIPRGHGPFVLYLNRSINEMTFQMAQLAREERVHLVSMPPGVQHLLHPLDESFAHLIEHGITKRARKWEEENPNLPFTQKVLAQILQKVWRKGINSNEIVRKFADNGVFPVNACAMSVDRIASAAAAMKDDQRTPPPRYAQKEQIFSGLNLLSALSSHEYASLDHILSGASEPANKTLSPEETTPNRTHAQPDDRVVVKVNRRLVPENDLVEDEQVVEETVSDQNISTDQDLNDSVEHFQGVSILNQSIESEPDASGKENAEKDGPEQIHQQLVAARDNPDQINRAIESIGGFEEPSPVKQEVVLEEVTEEEVIGETLQVTPAVADGTGKLDEGQQIVYSLEQVEYSQQPVDGFAEQVVEYAEDVDYSQEVVEQEVANDQPDLMDPNTVHIAEVDANSMLIENNEGEIDYSGLNNVQYIDGNVQYVTEGHLVTQDAVQTQYVESSIGGTVEQYIEQPLEHYVEQEVVEQEYHDVMTDGISYHEQYEQPVEHEQYEQAVEHEQYEQHVEHEQYEQHVEQTEAMMMPTEVSHEVLNDTLDGAAQYTELTPAEEPVISHAPGVATQSIPQEVLNQIMQQLGHKSGPITVQQSSTGLPHVKQIRIIRPKIQVSRVGGKNKTTLSHTVSHSAAPTIAAAPVPVVAPAPKPVRKPRIIRVVQPPGMQITPDQLRQIQQQIMQQEFYPAGGTLQ